MSRKIRQWITLGTAGFLLGVVAFAFWQQDLKYARPTPVPPSYRQIAVGSTLDLTEVPRPADAKPLVLHFFNPDCPCSRFNLDHVRGLVQRHKDDAHFVAVLQGDDAEKLQKQFASLGLGIASVPDTGGRIAAACGVYSTPQSVIVDAQGRLYFRGNYNASRYCQDPGTEFARIALESLLAGQPAPTFPPAATIAYGCELPAFVRNE